MNETLARAIVKRDGTVELDGKCIGGVVRKSNGMWMGFGVNGQGSGAPVRYRGTAVEGIVKMWHADQDIHR